MEPKLEEFLTKGDGKDIVVPKQEVIDSLQAIKMSFQDRIDTDIIESQIDRIISTINTKQADQIPLKAVQSLKRSAYDNAYNEAGNKVLDDVSHSIGDTFRSLIEKSTEGYKIDGKDIAAFNKEYGVLINTRKLLKIAASRKDVGFLSKLVSSAVGGMIGSIGGAFGSAAGVAVGPAVAEMTVGTPTRSAISAGLRTLSNIKAPNIKPLIRAGASKAIQQ
jgi:hypothetical protein